MRICDSGLMLVLTVIQMSIVREVINRLRTSTVSKLGALAIENLVRLFVKTLDDLVVRMSAEKTGQSDKRSVGM